MVNLLLAMGAYRLSGQTPSWKRLGLVGVLGGVYTAVAMVDRFYFLGDFQWRLMSLLILAFIGFGTQQKNLPGAAVYILLRLCMDAVDDHRFWPKLLFGALVMLLCKMWNQSREKDAEVSITWGKKHVRVKALLDTGNSLTDPVSGKSVMVVGSDVAENLLSLDAQALSRPLETMVKARIPGLRLIPYTAVGIPRGMLLGLQADQVLVNGKQEDLVIAFAPHTLGQGRQYQALVGGSL